MKTARLLASLLLGLAAPAFAGPVCDAVWRDAVRARDVPVRIRLPDGDDRVPVVLFSHGLGGSTGGGQLWGQAWAAAGIATIHIQHPGSDDSLLGGRPPASLSPAEATALLRPGMSREQFFARIADVAFVMDFLALHPREGACDLTRLDRARAGIAGHSFGAATTQAIAGQRFLGQALLRDPRFKAAVAFSPGGATRGTAAEAFGAIAIPFFAVTGSEDEVRALSSATPEARADTYSGLPAGGKYLLVFDGGDHLVFAGNNLRRAVRPSDAHIRAVVARATAAFWRATLLGDAKAATWLTAPDGLKSLLAPADRFESK